MVAVSGFGWQLAPSLVSMFAEADRRWPNRWTYADGSIGDAAHQARLSDHNVSEGYVHAGDLTHDPSHGVDTWKIANDIKNRVDPRVAYLVVWSPIRRHDVIWSVARNTEGWRLNGTGHAHQSHLHVSIVHSDIARNDLRPWFPVILPVEEREMLYVRVRNGKSEDPLYISDGLHIRHLGPAEVSAWKTLCKNTPATPVWLDASDARHLKVVGATSDLTTIDPDPTL